MKFQVQSNILINCFIFRNYCWQIEILSFENSRLLDWNFRFSLVWFWNGNKILRYEKSSQHFQLALISLYWRWEFSNCELRCHNFSFEPIWNLESIFGKALNENFRNFRIAWTLEVMILIKFIEIAFPHRIVNWRFLRSFANNVFFWARVGRGCPSLGTKWNVPRRKSKWPK